MSIENKNTDSHILTSPEIRRFQHQIDLPQFSIKGQEKIKQAKVVVIGAGGVGSQVLQLLAATGVGNITIIDDELVSEKNIQLQTLYGGNDLGKLKTIISRQQLLNLFPFINFEILNLKLNKENIKQFLSGNSIIIDACNTDASHYIINDACIELNKPWVYGNVTGVTGEVSVFNFNGGPSYRCLYPHEQHSNTTFNAVSVSLMYCLAGNIMATECVKIILNSPGVLSGFILNVDLFSNIYVKQPVNRIETNFKIKSTL